MRRLTQKNACFTRVAGKPNAYYLLTLDASVASKGAATCHLRKSALSACKREVICAKQKGDEPYGHPLLYPMFLDYFNE